MSIHKAVTKAQNMLSAHATAEPMHIEMDKDKKHYIASSGYGSAKTVCKSHSALMKHIKKHMPIKASKVDMAEDEDE